MILAGPCMTLYLALVTPLTATEPAVPITIELKSGSPDEVATRSQLERLLQAYDLKRWIFTKKVLVDRSAIPHSHPVLTLHTRHLRDDDLLLSTFVHEQIHWFLASKDEEVTQAKADLKVLYPKIPVGFPEGADSEDSGYEHLLVIWLEYRSDKDLMGELRAEQIMDFWSGDHYTWLYRQVLESGSKIAEIIRNRHLVIPK
jgi:hypothetical protein